MKMKAVFGILALIMVALTANPAFADRSTPVTVMNDIQNPIPVIQVAPGEPVPVTQIFSNEPIQLSGSGTITANSQGEFLLVTAPGNDQIFVIEYVSASFRENGGEHEMDLLQLYIETMLNGVACKHFVPTLNRIHNDPYHSPMISAWQGGDNVHIYVDSGTPINIGFYSSYWGPYQYEYTLVGYLMPKITE